MRFPGDDERLARLSLIDERGERYVRMANLACVGSHAINGVAELHSELLKQDVLADFHALWPTKFDQRHQRRHAAALDGAVQSAADQVPDHGAIGEGWITDLHELKRLEAFVDDAGLPTRMALHQAQRARRTSPTMCAGRTGVRIDPQSLFDVQVKRIHEYKRQHLNVLHVIALYLRLKFEPNVDFHAAHLRLRRQGGAGLPLRQADHPADHRGGRGRQHATLRCATG